MFSNNQHRSILDCQVTKENSFKRIKNRGHLEKKKKKLLEIKYIIAEMEIE